MANSFFKNIDRVEKVDGEIYQVVGELGYIPLSTDWDAQKLREEARKVEAIKKIDELKKKVDELG